MAQAIVPLTQEQLQQLINTVRETALSAAAAATPSAANNANKSKGSLSNCEASFYGLRDYEAVEEFINAVQTYKEIESISDEDALRGISLLFRGFASTWWQGVRKEAKSWQDALVLIREHFSPVKPPYQIYVEIFEEKQDEQTPIDTFVCEKRALLAQLPNDRHDEETELDLVYGLLNIKYRKHILRQDTKSFKDLLEKGRIIEQNTKEDEEAHPVTGARRKTKRCTHCHYRGHTSDECRKRKQATETN